MIHWPNIETVMLDMDGTLLDLHYDNQMWNQILPERLATRDGTTLEQARLNLFSQIAKNERRIEYYCLDYWSEHTQIDILQLHHEHSDLIGYLPSAELFLNQLRASDLTRLLVTNAHRANLRLKNYVTGLSAYFQHQISSLDYRAPKETRAFWDNLMASHRFDPARTLLIDDNEQVLDAAREFGVRFLLSVQQPDTRKPPREITRYPAIGSYKQLLPIQPYG